MYKANGHEDAYKICTDLLNYGGRGHTAGVHSQDEKVIDEFSMKMDACRILVNSPASVGGVGSRSIEVFAKIIGEHLTTGERFLGLTAFLTFVVPDKQIILPQVTPITEEEKIICAGYKDRKLEKTKKFARQKELNQHISLHLPWDKN